MPFGRRFTYLPAFFRHFKGAYAGFASRGSGIVDQDVDFVVVGLDDVVGDLFEASQVCYVAMVEGWNDGRLGRVGLDVFADFGEAGFGDVEDDDLASLMGEHADCRCSYSFCATGDDHRFAL